MVGGSGGNGKCGIPSCDTGQFGAPLPTNNYRYQSAFVQRCLKKSTY